MRRSLSEDFMQSIRTTPCGEFWTHQINSDLKIESGTLGGWGPVRTDANDSVRTLCTRVYRLMYNCRTSHMSCRPVAVWHQLSPCSSLARDAPVRLRLIVYKAIFYRQHLKYQDKIRSFSYKHRLVVHIWCKKCVSLSNDQSLSLSLRLPVCMSPCLSVVPCRLHVRISAVLPLLTDGPIGLAACAASAS